MDEEKGNDMTNARSLSFQAFDIESHRLSKDEKRLDAGFYARDAVAARVLIARLEERGIVSDSVEGISKDVFHRPRFKRKYVEMGEGQPFLTPTDLFMFPLKPRKSVVDPPNGLEVSPGWILITCSGTVGRTTIASSSVSQCTLSHDIIRIVPRYKGLPSYMYAYFNTWVGQVLLSKDKYGATVKHIEPHHVAAISIPVIPELRRQIGQKIRKAHMLRERAHDSLQEAQELLYSELDLPDIEEGNVEYFGGEEGRISKSFEIKASELNLRLDASYHLPILKQIESNLSRSRFKKAKLGSIIDEIFVPTRFKRPYVSDSKVGVPFLQGSHIPQMKPMDVKYVWRGAKNLKDITIQKDWVLMTRSGTVGRVCVVRDGWNGWAASEHIMRIVVKQGVNPGYVVAFLGCPYGEYQTKAKVYGGVVDEIGESDTSLVEEIDIVLPPRRIQDEIGNLVIEAYNKRDRANRIEDETTRLLEQRMAEIAEGE